MVKFLSISDDEINNLIFDKIKKSGETTAYDGKQDPTAYNMVVINAKSSDINAHVSLIQKALDSDTAVMLLDAGKPDKKALSQVIGFHNERQCAAYFLAPMVDKNGKRHYKIIEQFAPVMGEGDLMRQEAHLNHLGEVETTEPVTIQLSNTNAPELSHKDIAEFAQEVEADLTTLATSGALLQASSTPPAGAPYWNHLYSFKQPIAPSGSPVNGNSIPTGNQLFSGNATIGIYFDNVSFSDQPVQWLLVNLSGVYAANLTANTTDEKAWLIGGLQIQGPSPAELTFQQASPNSISGASTYTADTSFTIGLQAGSDGVSVNASYTESNSVSQSLQDWEITQSNEDGWFFFQQNPFNGTVFSDLTDGLSGSGVVSLPSITTSSLAFNTQTVWINEPPTSATQSLTYTFTCWPYAEYVYDPGKSWHGAYWGYSAGLSIPSDSWNVNWGSANPMTT